MKGYFSGKKKNVNCLMYVCMYVWMDGWIDGWMYV